MVQILVSLYLAAFLFLTPSISWAKKAPAVGAADSAYSKNIVLPLEGVLIQGVPLFLAKNLKPEDLITIDPRFYGIKPLAKELLRELVKEGYKIYLTSSFPQAVNDQILKAFKFSDGPGPSTLSQVVDKILSQEDMVKEKFDLDQLKLKDGFLLLQGKDDTINSSKLISIDFGQFYFLYDSYSAVEANRISTGYKATFFPKTKDEWFLERHKLGRLYLLLQEANRGSQVDVKAALKQLASEDQKHLTEVGTSQLLGTFQATIYAFQLNTEKTHVTGCETVEVRRQKKAPATPASCLANLPLKSLWTDRKKTQCGRFTDSQAFIDSSGNSCGEDHAFLLKKANAWVVYQENKEVRRLKDSELVDYLSGPYPDENDPYQLWEKYNDKKVAGVDLVACMDKQMGGRLPDECLPDTLYSWGPDVKLTFLKGTLGAATWPDSFRPLFLARSPVTTFGYGPIPVRVKIRKGVIIKAAGDRAHDTCTAFASEVTTTLFYRSSSVWMDWIICSPQIIHSLSYGTKKHYDEVVKDYRVHTDPSMHRRDYYAQVQKSAGSIFGASPDSKDFSKSALERAFKVNLNYIKNNEGEIFYNPLLDAKEKTEAIHFATDKPTFFNPE